MLQLTRNKACVVIRFNEEALFSTVYTHSVSIHIRTTSHTWAHGREGEPFSGWKHCRLYENGVVFSQHFEGKYQFEQTFWNYQHSVLFIGGDPPPAFQNSTWVRPWMWWGNGKYNLMFVFNLTWKYIKIKSARVKILSRCTTVITFLKGKFGKDLTKI